MLIAEPPVGVFEETARDALASTSQANVVCKIASTRAEREGSFRLIYQSYLRAGLTDVNPYGMRVTPYHLLPTTQIFVAVLERTVIETITLVGDGERGLPMEAVYAEEIAARRAQGLRIGEVSCLADRRADLRRFFGVFCELNRWMVQYARRQGLDQILVAVHPKHARFYTRYFCFEPIGEMKAYPNVCNRPAVALCMDFAQIDEKGREYPARHAKFFGDPIPPAQLAPQPMTAEELNYFGKRIDPRFAECAVLEIAT
jgi:hypothetical protein